MRFSEQTLVEALSAFEGKRIAICGDFYLDRYILGVMEGISREAPVPIIQIEEDAYSPGAAGNTALNVRALEAEVLAVGVIGDDVAGEIMRREFDRRGICHVHLLTDPSRHTPTYTKIYASSYHGRRQQVGRFDRENREGLSSEMEDRLLDALKEAVEGVDGVIVVDQTEVTGAGIATPKLLRFLSGWAAESRLRFQEGRIVVGDSRKRINEFKGLTALVPNDYEATTASGFYEFHLDEDIGEEAVERAGAHLARTLGCEAVFVTRGQLGISVFEKEGSHTHVPTVPAEGEVDITGAGDTVSAAITLSLCAGLSFVEAAEIGNWAAGVTVKKLGTTGTASKEEIIQRFRTGVSALHRKGRTPPQKRR